MTNVKESTLKYRQNDPHEEKGEDLPLPVTLDYLTEIGTRPRNCQAPTAWIARNSWV